MSKRLAALLTGILALLACTCGPLAAQDNPLPAEEVADSQLAGVVRGADGTPIPGSTLRVIQTATGKAWVTWSDEDGKFEFPALPEGHFRMETSQLGFTPVTQEVDLVSDSKTPVEVKMNVGQLSAITAPPAGPVETASANAPPNQESANAGQAGPPSSGGEGNAAAHAASTTAQNSAPPQPASGQGTNSNGTQHRGGNGGASGRNGQTTSAPNGTAQGGGRRAFQQLGLNGKNQAPLEATTDDQTAPEAGGQLGQAASADSVQMMGTIAMGQEMPGGPQQSGDNGPDTRTGMGGGDNTIPGQSASGGGGGGFGGGPGGFGGGGRRGGGGPRGPRGGPQSVAALWGAQRVMRQRINRVHYSFYESYGASPFNARPYSLYEANPPKIPSWTESAGVNMGGPLKIPHIYDGTDKTFFYINFGGTWSRTPVDQFATVPTLAERNGDFSADNVLLYNPLSNLSGPRSLMTNAGCFQATPTSPLPSAGTCIPTSMISSQASQLLAYIPLPNIPVTSLGGQSFNYHLQTNVPGISNRLNVNVTHQISAKLSLQVNYNFSDGTSHAINNFPEIEGDTLTRGQSAMVALTQNWTKTFLHNSQFYFSRNRSLGLNGFSNNTDISSQIGLTGISPSAYDFGLPSIGFTNFSGLSDPTFYLSRSQTYRYVDSLRWMKAKHTITVGGEVRKMDIDRDSDPAPNGQFSFTGLMTSQLTAAGTPVISPANCQSTISAGPCIGNDFADFLLGYPANTRVQYGDTATYFHNWGFIGYASDDFHVLPKFTVTYGVRYEAFTPPTEENGHIANLAVNSNFTQVQCVTPIATGNCIAGSTPSLFHGHYNNWAPRLGIAWQPPGKWFSGRHQLTLRAGFSMFYVEAYLNTLSAEMANQPPFATASTLTQQSTTMVPLSFQTNLSTALPNSVTNTVGVNPNYQVPYAMVWNASAEYNLASNMFLEVMYTGTRGIHLDELLGFSSATNGTTNAAGFTYDTTGAFSNFHALQLRLQKRMSHGLMFMGRYTYSKSLDDASTIGGGGATVIQDNADPRGDYGLSSFNMTHQILAQFVYQLPFGDRRRFAAKGWQKNVFGGWNATGNFAAHTGTPYTVRVFSTNQACQNVPGTNSERANQTGLASVANPSTVEWFNTSAFSIPTTSCFGDSARNSVIGPGALSLGTGVTKSIPFGRDGLRRLDFTWNVTNILNHPNFTGLSTVLGSRTFGQITTVGSMRAMIFGTRINF